MSVDIMMSENGRVSLLLSSDELVSGDYTYTVSGNEAFEEEMKEISAYVFASEKFFEF